MFTLVLAYILEYILLLLPRSAQRRVYNGNDRTYSLEFQAFSFPNGMIGDLLDPVCGAHQDQYTNDQSLLIQRLANCQAGFVPKYLQ